MTERTIKRKHMALLLAVVLGAAALVYFLYYDTADRALSEKPRPGTAAFSFRRQDVASLVLRRDGQNVVLENMSGSWVITQPEAARADQPVVNLMLDALASATSSQTLQVVTRRAGAYGLDSPPVTLELNMKGGERHRVRFGDPDPSRWLVYTLLDDAPEVALLPVEVAVTADQPLLNLRDRTLIDIRPAEIKSLRLHNENGRMTLTREGDNWQLKHPFAAAADRVAVESLLSEVRSARVMEFVSGSTGLAERLKHDKHQVTLTVQLPDGSEKTLTLGAKEGELSYAIASDLPQAGKVAASLQQRLSIKPSELFDRNIVKFNPDRLQHLTIRNQHQTLVALNLEDKWVVKAPSNYKDRELDLTGILNGLKAERADMVLYKPTGPVAVKLTKTALTVQLGKRDGSVITLLFSAPDGGRVYIRRAGSRFVYQTERHIFERLNFRVKDLDFPD